VFEEPHVEVDESDQPDFFLDLFESNVLAGEDCAEG